MLRVVTCSRDILRMEDGQLVGGAYPEWHQHRVLLDHGNGGENDGEYDGEGAPSPTIGIGIGAGAGIGVGVGNGNGNGNSYGGDDGDGDNESQDDSQGDDEFDNPVGLNNVPNNTNCTMQLASGFAFSSGQRVGTLKFKSLKSCARACGRSSRCNTFNFIRPKCAMFKDKSLIRNTKKLSGGFAGSVQCESDG